jgi:glycosyltransferase involved in cell wall biosynthesis
MFRKNVHSKSLVVVDSIFPQKEPMAFRSVEINEYLKNLKNFEAYTMYPMKPDTDAWFSHGYGVTKAIFKENLLGYSKYFPENTNRIHLLKEKSKYKFGLAYSFFLSETYVLLPFYEKNKIPFVFVLYPGGGFGLNNNGSDKMLRKIFNSPCFREVIVTQQITKDYLINNKLCSADKISFIYGGFVQFRKSDVIKKRTYPNDKTTFDICFVAAKYSKRGVDKGYDLFIDTAKRLVKVIPEARFHVVGGFDREDIDVVSLKDKITFYGYKKPEFLKDFYSRMDIFLAPNRPSKLFPGNFDGFPLGIDAVYCGVALFVADELKMNTHYETGKEVVVIGLDSDKIANKIAEYYNNTEELYRLSLRGKMKTQEIFDIDHQIQKRLDVFRKHLLLKERV